MVGGKGKVQYMITAKMSTSAHAWDGNQCQPLIWEEPSDDFFFFLKDLEQSLLVGSEQLAGFPLTQGATLGGGGGYSTVPDNESSTSRSRRIAFKVKSETESLDDGFRWRKYGKKMMKNSPHPRNYYKCLGEDCGVKKRVERDREDSDYVIVTYDGAHNHECPN